MRRPGTRNPNPLEKDIEKKVCDHAKALGCLVYKFTSPAKRSVPDRLFVMPGGIVFFIEFKRRGEKPTPAQALEISKLKEKGAQVFIIDNVDTGRCLIADLMHGRKTILANQLRLFPITVEDPFF